MKQEDHELIVLQILKEIKGRGFVVSGMRQHFDFLIKNNLIRRTELRDPLRTTAVTIKYSITDHGEGMILHLQNKYKELENAEQQASN